jgi:hypothetical protein
MLDVRQRFCAEVDASKSELQKWLKKIEEGDSGPSFGRTIAQASPVSAGA